MAGATNTTGAESIAASCSAKCSTGNIRSKSGSKRGTSGQGVYDACCPGLGEGSSVVFQAPGSAGRELTSSVNGFAIGRVPSCLTLTEVCYGM